MNFKVRFTAALVAGTFLSVSAQASTLWIGNDTQSPVEQWNTNGTFIGNFGAGGATGTALDGATAWTVQPGGSVSVITQYNASQTPLATINFNSGIDNGNGFPSWVEDMASGANHTLWLSGFNGVIYNVDLSGSVLSSFDSHNTFSGIEVVGNSVYTTTGTSGNSIFQYDLSGNLLSTITVAGMSGIGGLAYDPSDNTFWAGTFGAVMHVALNGTVLGSLANNNSSAFHDGLAIGDLSGTPPAVPLPGALPLFATGLGALGLLARRRKRKAGVAV